MLWIPNAESLLPRGATPAVSRIRENLPTPPSRCARKRVHPTNNFATDDESRIETQGRINTRRELLNTGGGQDVFLFDDLRTYVYCRIYTEYRYLSREIRRGAIMARKTKKTEQSDSFRATTIYNNLMLDAIFTVLQQKQVLTRDEVEKCACDILHKTLPRF